MREVDIGGCKSARKLGIHIELTYVLIITVGMREKSVNLYSIQNLNHSLMKKFLLTSAAMLVMGVSVSMAQSATTTTEASPKMEKKCSKSDKKACCAAMQGADASSGKKDCSSSSASAATEVKSTRVAAKPSTATALPVE